MKQGFALGVEPGRLIPRHNVPAALLPLDKRAIALLAQSFVRTLVEQTKREKWCFLSHSRSFNTFSTSASEKFSITLFRVAKSSSSPNGASN